jgi:hypothetical protein
MTRRSLASSVATGAALTAVFGAANPALASWSPQSGSGQTSVLARTLPAGGMPTATVSGTTVNVSWPSTVVAPGVPVSGYRVTRYDPSTGAAQTVLASCAGVLTSTSCAENGVPAGSWRYTVRPVQGNLWTGTESATGAAVTVQAVSVPTITGTPANPTNQTGATFQFSAQSGATFECALDGGPSAACTSPKTFAGPLTEGGHTFAVRAKDGNGVYSTAATFTWTVDTTAPSATDVQTTNAGGGTVGKTESRDVLTLTYSEPIDPTSISASGWANGLLPVTVRLNKGAGQASDTITVYDSTNTTQLASLGTVNLGQNGYAQNSVAFTGSTVALSGSQVVITLGTASGSVKTVSSGANMVWTPGSGVKDLAGNSLGSGAAVTELHPGGADIDF